MGAKDIVKLDDNWTDVPRPSAPPVHVRTRRTSLLALIRGRSRRRQTITNSCHVLTSLQ